MPLHCPLSYFLQMHCLQCYRLPAMPWIRSSDSHLDHQLIHRHILHFVTFRHFVLLLSFLHKMHTLSYSWTYADWLHTFSWQILYFKLTDRPFYSVNVYRTKEPLLSPVTITTSPFSLLVVSKIGNLPFSFT